MSKRTTATSSGRPRAAKAPLGTGAAFIVCMLRARELRQERLDQLIGNISSNLGRVLMLVPELQGWRAPWQYKVEMGEDLVNVAVVLEQPLSLSGLVALKYWTMETESLTRIDGKRTLNLNPGLVLEDRVIVASHKPSGSMRKYLAPSCWTQTVALRTPKGQYIPSRTTYSEYAATCRLSLFERLGREDLAAEVQIENGAEKSTLDLTTAYVTEDYRRAGRGWGLDCRQPGALPVSQPLGALCSRSSPITAGWVRASRFHR